VYAAYRSAKAGLKKFVKVTPDGAKGARAISIVLSNVSSEGIECIEDVIYEIIEIYKKYLIKNLSNTRNIIYGSSINMSTNSNNDIRNENSNNNEDNGAHINNGGSGNLFNNGIDNGGGNQNVENISGQIRDTNNNNNYFNETVTSIYFSNKLNSSVKITGQKLAKCLVENLLSKTLKNK